MAQNNKENIMHWDYLVRCCKYLTLSEGRCMIFLINVVLNWLLSEQRSIENPFRVILAFLYTFLIFMAIPLGSLVAAGVCWGHVVFASSYPHSAWAAIWTLLACSTIPGMIYLGNHNPADES